MRNVLLVLKVVAVVRKPKEKSRYADSNASVKSGISCSETEQEIVKCRRKSSNNVVASIGFICEETTKDATDGGQIGFGVDVAQTRGFLVARGKAFRHVKIGNDGSPTVADKNARRSNVSMSNTATSKRLNATQYLNEKQ